MRGLLCLTLLVVLLTGCAGLALQNTDTTGDKVGKVLFRTVLGLATLGISEVAIASEVEAQARKDRFQAWWAQASPEERVAYQARQADLARLLLPSAFQGMQRRLDRWGQAPQAPAPRQPVHCSSYMVGTRLQTYCD